MSALNPDMLFDTPAPGGSVMRQSREIDRQNPLRRELRFTEVYKEHIDDHPAMREAHCLKALFPGFLAAMQPGDLFVGRLNPTLIGFSPDEWGPTAFGYWCRFAEIEEVINKPDLLPEHRAEIEEMVDFWREHHTSGKLRAAYPPDMARWIPSDDWMNESGVAFPLYRLTGGNIDFGKLMHLGTIGLRAEIMECRAAIERGSDHAMLFQAMLMALNVFDDVCLHFEGEIRRRAVHANVDDQRELLTVAGVLARIRKHPPRNFREALQLFWLYSLLADVRNYGRMDVYLGDFLAKDLEVGALTEGGALDLLQSIWRLMAARHTVVHNRVIVGGKGRPSEANADLFAMYAMEATRTVSEIEPQLSLRFYEGQNPALFEKALDVLAEGRTFPILYNDEVNLPAIQKAFGWSAEEVLQYVPYGCGEYILEHQSFGTPSGVINLLKALEVTLRNGIDPVTGSERGLPLGTFEDFATFEDLWDAYAKQVEHFTEIMARQQMIEYEVAGQDAAYLYMSMLYDDCLERGKAIFSGGIRYLGGTFETYGNANTADSLTAIRKLVYEDQAVSRERLLAALDADFVGFERERNLLMNAPKYGNDDDEADAMLMRVHDHVCKYTRAQAEKVGLHSYLVVIINNSANTLMGRSTSASADGRRAFTSMNNGNAPSSGNDRMGVTAFLNSIVKPDPSIHAGAVQNMKFSRGMFDEHRSVLESLLKTYFKSGGTQAMITVVDRDDLQKAMEDPEKYGHIFVRVGGFSARFVELPRDVQTEILNRTIY